MTPYWVKSIHLEIFILIILLTTKPQCSRSGHGFHGVQKDQRTIQIRSESYGSVMISPDMVNKICAMQKPSQKCTGTWVWYFQTNLHNKDQVIFFLSSSLFFSDLLFICISPFSSETSTAMLPSECTAKRLKSKRKAGCLLVDAVD